MYALITGFMEAGESPQAGFTREVKEETSLDVTSLSLIGAYEFLRMNQVIIAYGVQAKGEVRLSPDLADYRLYEYDQAKCRPAGTVTQWPNGFDARESSPSFWIGRSAIERRQASSNGCYGLKYDATSPRSSAPSSPAECRSRVWASR
jgi:NAD+ diphosphatase